MPEIEQARSTVTFDADIKHAVTLFAAEDRRGFSDEVNVLLKEAIEARKGKRK